MKMTAKMAEKKLNQTVRRMTIEKLIELWEETERRFISQELAIVRGAIMDALEAKDHKSFDRWMSAEYTTPESDMPRTYFINA